MKQEEFPPVPTQLLWMFDAIDRKEATKMMHDYAKTAVTARLAKPLREAWERAQKAEDRTTRLEDGIAQMAVLCATANALLHQLDIGEFLDEHGHNATMLKPTHDLMMILSGDKFQLAGLLEEHEERVWNNAIDAAIDQYRYAYIDGCSIGPVPESLARLKR